MPIRPENKNRYPKNWKEIRKLVLERANNRCEFCDIENYSRTLAGTKVVLTIAHMEPPIENCSLDNLKALCQRCHLSYDMALHVEQRRLNREKARGPLLFPEISNN